MLTQIYRPPIVIGHHLATTSLFIDVEWRMFMSAQQATNWLNTVELSNEHLGLKLREMETK